MTVARSKTWVVEVLTASDLNGEFDNILDNQQSLGTPRTAAWDMNAQELILDLDGDTSITADTNDTVHFKIGGTDLLTIDASARLLIGDTASRTIGGAGPALQITSTGATHGAIQRFSADASPGELLFGKSRDAIGTYTTALSVDDGLGSISAYGADGIDMANVSASIKFEVDATVAGNKVPGRISFHTENSSSAFAERMRLDSSGSLHIGHTANANMTVGLTINKGANTDQILALKSDIATVVTTATTQITETDDFAVFHELDANGGLKVTGISNSTSVQGLALYSYSGAPNTTDDTSTGSAMNFFVGQHDGANGLVDMAAESNGFSWGEINNGGAAVIRMTLKADDGELHLGNTTLVAFDGEDDIQMIRELQRVTHSDRGIVPTKYDQPIYSHAALHRLGLVGPKDEDGEFLICVQPILGALMGATWQLYTRLQDSLERLTLTENKLLLLENKT